MERDTTKYIVLRVLPTDPALATSLLTTLLRSNPSSLRTIRHLLERQGAVLEREQNTMEDIRQRRRDMLSFLNQLHRNKNNNKDNDNDTVNSNKHKIAYGNDETADDAADVADMEAGSAEAGHQDTNFAARKMRLSPMWKPSRLLMPNKRSLGRCIHECINGKGNMNFIQCKSMCH